MKWMVSWNGIKERNELRFQKRLVFVRLNIEERLKDIRTEQAGRRF